MARALEVNIGANTREFVTGTKDMSKSLENVADSLDDVVRDSDKFEKKVSDDLKEVAKQARQTGDGVGDDMSRGMRRAGDGVEDFKGEANSTAKEVAASFSGSAEDIAGGFQEVAANALGGFGPIGAAAGLALAAGIGIFTAKLQEDAEASEERVQSMYDSFVESGLNWLTDEERIDAISAITGDPEKIATFRQQAKDLGVDVETIILAQIEKGEERNKVQDVLNGLIDESNRKLEEGTYTDGTRLTTLEGYLSTYQNLNGEQKKSVDGAELYRSTVAKAKGETAGDLDLVQKRNKAVADAPKSVSVKLSVDDTALTRYAPKALKVPVEWWTRSGQKVQ